MIGFELIPKELNELARTLNINENQLIAEMIIHRDEFTRLIDSLGTKDERFNGD